MALESIRPVGGGITLVVFSSVLIPLTVVFVSLRLWARHILRKTLELNDYLVVFGAILAVVNATLMILAVVYGGVGHHQPQVMHLYPELAKITLALAIVWTVANTFVKLSIMHLYMVIFHSSIPFRLVSYAVMFLITGYCITNIILTFLTCKPIAFNWDKTIPGGHCSTQESPFLSFAIINISIDIIIFSLPLPMLWGLQLNKKKKISLVIIFSLGFLICIISTLRIRSIKKLDFLDFSYSVVSDGIYSVLEPCFGVINACLPVLQPVGTKLAQSKLFSSFRFTLHRTSQNPNLNKTSCKKELATIGGSGQKKKFHQIDDELSVNADDQYPLTSISVGGVESNLKVDERW